MTKKQRRLSIWISGGLLLAAAALLMAASVFHPWRRSLVDYTLDADQARADEAETSIQQIKRPWVIAVQPGHFKIEELPDELAHRRGDTGATHGYVFEKDINRAVAAALIPMIQAAGWQAFLVPATIRPGLRVDAFLSIHVDGGGQSSLRGWKLSPPWRPSRASIQLADAMRGSFAAESQLREEKGGVTIFMRGYFSFNYRRYRHAISPFTPAVLVELGRIGNRRDRELLTGHPEYWAGILLRGLKSYFGDRDRFLPADLRPMQLPWVIPGPGGVSVRLSPRENAKLLVATDSATPFFPVDESSAWYEVFVRKLRRTGWVLKSEVIATNERRWPWRRAPSPER